MVSATALESCVMAIPVSVPAAAENAKSGSTAGDSALEPEQDASKFAVLLTSNWVRNTDCLAKSCGQQQAQRQNGS